MKYFIVSIISLIIGFSGSYILYYFKYKNLNNLYKSKTKLNEDINELTNTRYNLETIIIERQKQKENLLKEQSQLSNSLIKIKEFYDKQRKDIVLHVSEDVERSINNLENDFSIAQEECKQQYLELIEDLQKEFLNQYSQKESTLKNIEENIETLRSIEASAIKMREQEYEKVQKENFYKLILSKEDLEEVNELRKIATSLRDATPLNKVIWKVYYEKPYTDLVGRLIGSTVKTGIYKITNVQTGMCYVGQATDISNRFRQHIKRGLGAETPTKNKLYNAMKEFGVENFTFEIIQECSRADLNKQEDYWQDYFKAKEFGYSIK